MAAVIGFGVGLTVGAIVLYLILRKMRVIDNVANTPDMQRLMGCLGTCSQKGLAFGSAELRGVDASGLVAATCGFGSILRLTLARTLGT